ncbi:hypothetical protein ACHAW5_005028 [Stephanodiscus triporus]|uniref:CS domain-containing protein n=1 Tax=Stephanodiscus triporus TaxID=2934178 RepID=A0ABD3NMG6_9STRA
MSRPAAPYSAGTPMLSPAEMLKFEAPLVALADLSGGDLRKLFYAFFSFLNARTDFYCIAPPSSSAGGDGGDGGGGGGRRMGFREGQAEQILLASFRQFPLRRVAPSPPSSHPRPGPAEARGEGDGRAVPREVDGPTEGSPSSPSSSSGGGPKIPASPRPPVDATSEDASPGVVDDDNDDDDAETATTNTTTAAVASVGSDADADVVVASALPRSGATGKRSAARYTDLGERVLDDDDDDDDDAETTTTVTTTTSDADTDAAVAFLRSSGGETRKSGPSSSSSSSPSSSSSVRYTDEGKQVPVGNGGSTSRYVWTQTLEEVTVHVPLPDGTRARDLDVRIGANTLTIRRRRGGGGGGTREEEHNINNDAPSLEGTLFARVRPSESTWTLESNDSDGRGRSTRSSRRPIATLQLVLEKVQKTWWETVISGDTPLIDTTMVDSTRHIGTYDDETQAEIRRIMFDQRQERLGLPTSQRGATTTTTTTSPGGYLPPLSRPDGERKFAGGAASLPSGVEYIDGETLDRYSTATKNVNDGGVNLLEDIRLEGWKEEGEY